MSLGYVLLSVEAFSEKEVMKQLERIESVVEIYEVYGPYGLMVKMSAESPKEIENCVKRKIRTIKQVRQAFTLIVGKMTRSSPVRENTSSVVAVQSFAEVF